MKKYTMLLKIGGNEEKFITIARSEIEARCNAKKYIQARNHYKEDHYGGWAQECDT